MKTIKFLLILAVQFVAFQAITAQNQTDENGRLLGTQPADKVQKQEVKAAPDVFDGDDLDVEGERKNILDHLTPVTEPVNDRDEVPEGYLHQEDILVKITQLEEEIKALKKHNADLQAENRSIQKGMSNCCADATFDLALEQSFLLQNSPNPFANATKIQFFMPDDVENATIEVRNLQGILMGAYDVDGGIGEITIDGASFAQGTYVYTLKVDGQLIDSKVMILTDK